MGEILTAQEVFDRVVDRLRDGTGPAAVSPGCDCRYLMDDGRKCAVGIFIPDGHEAQRYEGCIDSLIEDHPSLFAGPIGHHRHVLYDLQSVHDSGRSWSEDGKSLTPFAEARLLTIAQHFGLDYAEQQGRAS